MGSGEVLKTGLVWYYIWLIQCQSTHLRTCMCVLCRFRRARLFETYGPCIPPGSSVHGILQARILDWAAISSSRGSSWPRDQTRIFGISCTSGRHFTHWATWESCQHSLGLMSPLTWRQGYQIYGNFTNAYIWALERWLTMTLYARQQKRHRCKEQSFGLCGRRRWWDDLRG